MLFHIFFESISGGRKMTFPYLKHGKIFPSFFCWAPKKQQPRPSVRGNANPKPQGQFSTHSLVALLCHLLVLALVKVLSSWCQRATCQYRRLVSKRYQSDVKTMCSQVIDAVASWLEQCDITPTACQRNVPVFSDCQCQQQLDISCPCFRF